MKDKHELEQIQGVVLHGYKHMPVAAFLLTRIDAADGARRWLDPVVPQITAAGRKPGRTAINLAITHDGLRALSTPASLLAGFSREFREGMAMPDRQRILGDVGASAPQHWQWGGAANPAVHMMLMLYADSESGLQKLVDDQRQSLRGNGCEVVHELRANRLPGEREHFGFRDGVSQPAIAGFQKARAMDTIAAGEFIMGYRNEYDEFPVSPVVGDDIPHSESLAAAPDDAGMRDFGRYGTYLVFRQVAQDVPGFWRYTSESSGDYDAVTLASKMVGRWPSGAQMLPGQDADPGLAGNDFAFHRSDPYGLGCPLGSHIRRANPRDSLEPRPGSRGSIQAANVHRILRRGRTYGPPLAASMDVADLIAAPADGVDRGLHFMCLNSNIARQFEFVQQTWLNNRKFSGLYAEVDPLVGAKSAADDSFTVQAEPLRRRVRSAPEFVQTRGGSYFFLPGVHALRFLASG